MANYKNKFSETLEKFIKEMDKICPSKDIDKIKKYYKKLDMKKIMKKYLENMEVHKDKIAAGDVTMFEEDVIVLPGINIKDVWNQMNDKQHNKMFVYLKMLYILSEICVSEDSATSGSNDTETISTIADSSELTIEPVEEPTLESNQELNRKSNEDENEDLVETKSLEFNPFEGVGGNAGGNAGGGYDVKGMFDSVGEYKIEKPGLGSMANLIGADKLLNLDELTDQLKNMDKKDIDEATLNIQNLMGSNMDDKTSKAIGDMLGSISSELKTRNLKEGNLFDNLTSIANTVAEGMRPKIDRGELDVKDLWSSTQNLANKCKEEVGGAGLGLPGGLDPMSFLSNMVQNQANMQDPSKMEDALKMQEEQLTKMMAESGLDMSKLKQMEEELLKKSQGNN